MWWRDVVKLDSGNVVFDSYGKQCQRISVISELSSHTTINSTFGNLLPRHKTVIQKQTTFIATISTITNIWDQF